MEVKARFRGPESVPFPLNRGVPSTEVIDKTILYGCFSRTKFVSPEWGCPSNRGVPKERFHCNSKLCLGVWCLDIPFKNVAELTCKLSPATLFAAALLAPSCAPFDALWAAAPPKVKTITALHKTGLQLGCNNKIRNYAAFSGHIVW